MYNITGSAIDSNGSTTLYSFSVQSDGTSFPEQVQSNLFFGFILFFIISGSIIFYFQRKFK